MHVVRMIKFFAWEKRIESQLDEKRNEELTWIKRSKLLTVVNDNIKCVYTNATHLPVVLTISRSSDLIPLLTMVVTYATFVSSHPLNMHANLFLIMCRKDISYEAFVDR